ncbi:MAG TPA: tRNA (adenine-N1)-methyltransferase [Caldilineae bacterium]|nr:tRNA (adenine-N1)-methyltransferase [Caldilineae bacterium]
MGHQAKGTEVRIAQENDLVMLVSPDRRRHLVRLRAGAEWHTHRGRIRHDELIGRPFGSTVHTHSGYPYLLLEPSTQDLILQLKRTTQIVYPKDAAYIVLRLNLFSGRQVVEAGTGSGGLTLAMARAVMPEGHVYSYEVRPEMQELARRNLEPLGLLPYITFRVRDIAEGFDERDVDACFLDLRTPWEYLAQAYEVLKPGGFFGSLVPTANQVIELLAGLEGHGGFAEIEVEELSLRPYKPVPDRLRPADRMVAHTAYLIFARKVALGDEAATWRPAIRKPYLSRLARQEAMEEAEDSNTESEASS